MQWETPGFAHIAVHTLAGTGVPEAPTLQGPSLPSGRSGAARFAPATKKKQKQTKTSGAKHSQYTYANSSHPSVSSAGTERAHLRAHVLYPGFVADNTYSIKI